MDRVAVETVSLVGTVGTKIQEDIHKMRRRVPFPSTPPWLSDKESLHSNVWNEGIKAIQIKSQHSPKWNSVAYRRRLAWHVNINNLNMLSCVPLIILLTGKHKVLPGGLRKYVQKVTFTYLSQDV